MSVITITQPPFQVSTEAERSTSWPNMSFVFCQDTKRIYQLISGTFYLVNPVTRTQSAVTRSINNTGYQISATADAMVLYSIRITAALTLSGGNAGTVFLEISPDNTNWTTISQTSNSNTGALTIGLNTSDASGAILTGFVPVGYYTRLRSSSTTGTATFSYLVGQEILFS